MYEDVVARLLQVHRHAGWRARRITFRLTQAIAESRIEVADVHNLRAWLTGSTVDGWLSAVSQIGKLHEGSR